MDYSEEAVWRQEAACARPGIDIEIFFPHDDQDRDQALSICRDCPVRRQCLDYAITSRIHEGIFGGVTPKGRDSTLAKIREKRTTVDDEYEKILQEEKDIKPFKYKKRKKKEKETNNRRYSIKYR
ncbi:hypothetical protein NCPPB3778_56 [Rathayibacter phage NCPPB3778]|nr:hypothetical protein NCPPB3778_56 [Rathayibacter phage NCPPB3778]